MNDYSATIQMNIDDSLDERFVVISFKGELDKAGLESIKEKLSEVETNLKGKYLVFDFKDLNFINSEGIGYLMTMHYRLTKKEKELAIVNAVDHVYDVLNVIGLLTVIKYFGSLEDFKAFLN